MSEAREAVRLLSGLENGNIPTADLFNIADKLDPVVIYFVLRFLREKYPASEPASQGVARRVVELTGTYDKIVKMSKAGEKDSMREWFDDTYNMREWLAKGDEFVEMIVEKLEG